MSTVTGIGVIGTGHWGVNHIRNFETMGNLRAFCDSDADARQKAVGLSANATPYSEVEDLLAAPDVDAVVIATPAGTHGAIVRQALDAGKHVLVEKPLCLDVGEAKLLEEQANELGLVLMIGHLLLYHPGFRAVRDLSSRGTLGDLRYIYSNRLSLGKVRLEENALWSFAPHDISMILALTGAMPTSVMASGGHYLNDTVADTTLSLMTFPGNIQAHIFVSWLHPFKDHRMVVVGDKGMVAFDDVQTGPDKVLVYPHALEWNGNLPVFSREGQPVPYADDEPLSCECKAFIDAIEHGHRPPSDAAEGVRVLTVLNACQEAMRLGTKVSLDG